MQGPSGSLSLQGPQKPSLVSLILSILAGYCEVQGFVLIRQHGSNLLSALPLACAQQDFAEIVKAWVPMAQVHQKLLCLGPC